MSDKTYTWLDEAHTQVAESIDPPEPTVIVIADLEAEIAALSASIVELQDTKQSDAEILVEVKAFVSAAEDTASALAFVTDKEDEAFGLGRAIASKTTQRDALQSLLDTINAEAT